MNYANRTKTVLVETIIARDTALALADDTIRSLTEQLSVATGTIELLKRNPSSLPPKDAPLTQETAYRIADALQKEKGWKHHVVKNPVTGLIEVIDSATYNCRLENEAFAARRHAAQSMKV